jgi:hypothetical protein
MEKCCQNCIFFESANSFCRRFPPTPLVVKKKTQSKFVVEGMFPIISKPTKDWCGEFEEIPSKTLLID